jgi:methionyl-tRNA formyltransferase
MNNLRVIFMGTPDFAVPSLDRLVQLDHVVVAVVTQPDRPKGRGQKLQPSPVKEYALQAGLPLLQPEKIKEPAFIDHLEALRPDVIIVVAFGQFLPQRVLDLPTYGCINVHASLLPKYRGAAPIHWAILSGEIITGVTTMQMDIGMDTGDILLMAQVPIAPDDTTGQLHDRLMILGADLLAQTLEGLGNKSLVATPQDKEIATNAPLLTRETEHIQWQRPAKVIHNQVRGLNPWPGAYCLFRDKVLKVWQTEPRKYPTGAYQPGQVLAVDMDSFLVATTDGALECWEVQPESKKRMGCGQFSRGYGLLVGEILK